MADGTANSFKSFCTLHNETLTVHQNVSPGLGVLWKMSNISSKFNVEQPE
jgi:hypothetical protein